MFTGRMFVVAVLAVSGAVYVASGIDIAELKSRAAAEGWTFEVGDNSVTDIPLEKLCGLIVPDDWPPSEKISPKVVIPTEDLPVSHDWRLLGGCTPVKNQRDCGSCWAFAAAGAAEAAILVHTGVEADLSEQWMVSCTGAGSCSGGWYGGVFGNLTGESADLCEKSGAVLEEDFVYMAEDIECVCSSERPYVFMSWGAVGSSIEEIKAAILKYGSVAVGVSADEVFMSYKSGVYNYPGEGSVNHAVLLVGWDDSQGEEGVWFLRNSWGAGWGENGYMRIAYNVSSVGTSPAYIEYTSDNDPNMLIVPADYPTIVSAVSAAGDGDIIVLEPGVYTGEGNRNISYVGKAITIMSVNPSDPSTVANTVIDCQGYGRAFVFNTNEKSDSVLWGVTVRNGLINNDNGGAIYCYYSKPTIKGCVFDGNAVTGYMKAGGAIAFYNSSPIIKDCTITNNSASYYGGGISCRDKSAPAIVNCRISGNQAGFEGGGVYCWVDSQPYIKSSLIASNTAAVGGGVYFYECDSNDPNIASGFADPCMKLSEDAPAEPQEETEEQAVWGIDNCTIAYNIASSTGGGIFCLDSIVKVRNSILWRNRLSSGQDSQATLFDDSLKGTTIEIFYSDVMGGAGGVSLMPDCILNYDTASNIDADPLFADVSAGDYHLMSSSGRWSPQVSNWVLDDGGNLVYSDDMNSPCIDAGDPESGFCLESKCNGGRINMGAYGNTYEASRSYSGECCMLHIPGDLNEDCRVNLEDLMIIATNWLDCTILPRYYCAYENEF